ncbi:hypothetical protein Asch01_02314 [Acinetobacter schindleri]|uniref:PH domain-containing protein n=1 Tax=Acinetobacter schindleri TaxID=108981 RepID=UPI0030A405DA
MQVFRSKKDWWLVAFLVCMTGLLVQLLLVMSAKGAMQQYPLHTAVYMLTIVMIWWPVLNTRYQLTADQLIVKSMWFSWQIPVAAIQAVTPTDYSSVAPALSLKRLRVDYREDGTNKFVLISPKDQMAFINAVQNQQAS